MADESVPPLVALSGGSSRGYYSNQMTAVVDVHQPFNGPAVEKSGCRLPDGIVIRPDPGMPALMSVSYEEPQRHDANVMSRPIELGQVKILPHADFPIIKQEVCDTLDCIKEKFNQSDIDDNSVPHVANPHISWLVNPTTSTPKLQTAKKSVPPLNRPGPKCSKKAAGKSTKKSVVSPAKSVVSPAKSVVSPSKTSITTNGQKEQNKSKKRKLDESLQDTAAKSTKKAKVSPKVTNSKSKVGSETPKASPVKEKDTSIDPFEFDEPSETTSTPVVRSPSNKSNKRGSPGKGVKNVSLESGKFVNGKSPGSEGEQHKSPKKVAPLRIALKEPKKVSKKSDKGNKKQEKSARKSSKSKEEKFTQVKSTASKILETKESVNDADTSIVLAGVDLSVSEDHAGDAEKIAGRKSTVIGEATTKDSDGALAADAVIKVREDSNNAGDGETIAKTSSASTALAEPIDIDLDDAAVSEIGKEVDEPIVIEPASSSTESGAAEATEDQNQNAANAGAKESYPFTTAVIENFHGPRKNNWKRPGDPTAEDPVPLRWSAPKSRQCDYPPKSRAKSPVKGANRERGGRMTSPLRSPMSPGVSSVINELEAEDMDLALDIASRIQDQFTEAEFEQLFNNPGANSSGDVGSAGTANTSLAKTKSKSPPGVPEAPSVVTKDKYKLLDCYIPLNDCSDFKKKSQTLLKVPPRRNQLHRCEICKGVFIDYQALTLHKWSHEKEKFACTKCNTYYTSEKNLKWHVRVTHKVTGNFQCRFCQKRFLHEQYKKEHEKLHLGTSKYKCRICGKMFFGMTGYRGHMRRHLGFEPFKCKTCGQGFALLQELNYHVVRHTGNKKFKCRFCGKGFYGMYECKRHEFSHSGERPFRCKFCGKRYSNKWSCEAHEKYHSGELHFQCPVCNKRFATKHQLRNHAMFHSDIKPFKCQYCDKAFVNRQILVCHERIHTKERPFKCSYCPKAFAQASDRRAHERTHTGEKPFSCKQCNRTFRKQGALRLHEKTHSGERNVKCNLCNWVFPDTEQVKKHQRRHQKNTPIPCFFCNRYFEKLEEHDQVHLEEKEPYRCCMCNSRFITFQDRYLHEKTHLMPRRFNCAMCPEDFCRRNVRDNHEKTMHLGVREKVACPMCNKFYADEAAVRMHIKKLHDDNRPTFKCQYCHKEFKSEEYKNRHEAIHLGLDEKFNCSMCDYVTNRKYLLKVHVEKHLSGKFDKPRNYAKRKIFHIDSNGDADVEKSKPAFKMDDNSFRCTAEGCDAVYTSSFSLLAHMRRHKRQHNCDVCSQSCSSTRDLKEHIKKVHGKVKCEFCYELVAGHDLAEHKTSHENESDPHKCFYCTKGFAAEEDRKAHEATHTGPRPFSCLICNRAFNCKSHWNYHQRTHTGTKPYECLTCKKRFTMSSALTEHVRRVHVGGRELKCRICGKVCDSHPEMKMHSLVHRHERRYKCDMCTMAFFKSDHLNAHKQRHLGIKPFKCEVCKCGFSSRNGLNKHIANFHSGGKKQGKFKCEECDKTFPARHVYRVHMNTHKPPVKGEYQCKFCGQEFQKKFSWAAHEANHQNRSPTLVYKCDVCGRKFASLGSLNYHQIFHGENEVAAGPAAEDDAETRDGNDGAEGSNDQSIESNEENSPSSKKMKKGKKSAPKKNVLCVICGGTFYQGRSLDRHMEKAHPEVARFTKPSEYTCAICDMTFKKKIILLRHMKSHQLGMGDGAEGTEEGSLEVIQAAMQGVINTTLGDANNNSPLAKDRSAAATATRVTDDMNNTVSKSEVIEDSATADTSMDVINTTIDSDDPIPSTSKGVGVNHECHICGQRFLRPSLLTKHLEMHKGFEGEAHKCSMCPKVFWKLKGLKQHMTRSHKSLDANTVALALETSRTAVTSAGKAVAPQVRVESPDIDQSELMLQTEMGENNEGARTLVIKPQGSRSDGNEKNDFQLQSEIDDTESTSPAGFVSATITLEIPDIPEDNFSVPVTQTDKGTLYMCTLCRDGFKDLASLKRHMWRRHKTLDPRVMEAMNKENASKAAETVATDAPKAAEMVATDAVEMDEA